MFVPLLVHDHGAFSRLQTYSWTSGPQMPTSLLRRMNSSEPGLRGAGTEAGCASERLGVALLTRTSFAPYPIAAFTLVPRS